MKRYCHVGLLLAFLFSCLVAHSQSTEKVYLSGTDGEHTVDWDFYCTSGCNSGVWTKMTLLSQLEQEGFGYYDYGRHYRTYSKDFRFSDEEGMYKHLFEVPKPWKRKVVQIVFEGSMTDTEVKINGVLAGPVHQGAFYLFKYDISDKVKYGETNTLGVKVSKMSANKSVNRAERYADCWIFGGIYGSVYLEVLPEYHLTKAAGADGHFKLHADLNNPLPNVEVKLEIVDFSKPDEKGMGLLVNRKCEMNGLNLLPGGKGAIDLKLPPSFSENDTLVLTAFDINYNEIFTWSWLLKSNSKITKDIVGMESGGVDFSETEELLTLNAAGIYVSFDKSSGQISGLKNDTGRDLLFGYEPLTTLGETSFKSMKHYGAEGLHAVEMKYEGALKSAKWKMSNTGWFELEYEYGETAKTLLAGISFTYPEFKGYYSDIVWPQINTSEGALLVTSKEEHLFVPLFNFTGLQGPDKYYPELPVGNISFLGGIPPFGNKLATDIKENMDEIVPSDELNELDEPVTCTLYFYLGLLAKKIDKQYLT